MPAILVTSAGSGVATAVAEAAAANAYRIRVAGATTDPQAAEHAGLDRIYRVPLTAQREAFQRAILKLARAEAPCVLLAGRDADVEPLAAIENQLAAEDARWTGPGYALARRAHDKAWVARTLRAAGLPAVVTAVGRGPALRLARTFGYPLVVKPRYGSGSRDVHFAQDDRQLIDLLGAAERPMVVQPYLWAIGRPRREPTRQVDEYSAQVVVTSDCVAGPFVTRNALRNGTPVEAEVVSREALDGVVAKTVEVLRPFGLRGPLNVQCRETARDVFEVFELNFRCTGLTGARAKMGFHELDYLFQMPGCTYTRDVTAACGLVAAQKGRFYVCAPRPKRLDQ
jgi:carbamoylphosphate synthase large subunit